jgi:hypothetical protein
MTISGAIRAKNRHKTAIDWDLNIFMPEELDQNGESYWDPASWKIHVYAYVDGTHEEWDAPIELTAGEIRKLGLNRDPYFKDEVDVWYGLDGFKFEYWSLFSDRLKEYFDRLPKYWEDINDFQHKAWKMYLSKNN